MSQPATPLSEQEQQQLVRQIGRAMLPVLPQGWQRVRAEYRAAGRHIEVDLAFAGPDGQWRPVRPPMDVVGLFGRLRTGMYAADRGTWLSAVYEIEAPSQFTVDFNAEDEPRWRNAPPVIGFQDELRAFPRADDRIPDWLRHRLGLPPRAEPVPPGELRTAHVYDGRDEEGRPVVRRQAVDPRLREALLTYLEAAPVVLAARDLDVDEFAPGDRDVPLNFRTDGTWVWAGAVPHYLRKHGLPPEPALVRHILDRDFRVSEVDDAVRDRAVALITGSGD
ncbi:hypothetical protein [Saccharothrix australiensis]|uniref:Uncharacterized protein n=1 Tax=Saccharothrix australiensis TaxID=2072 RepID=A0A495W4V3_9PSEU|nr:hypothetical protein [Saccharothrix australiensis]RKT56672.1 hypothetical protein C8E97_5381 [Saccharothrix australiensis]